MSTPGGVELDEDILVVVDDQVIVGVGDDNGNRTLLLLGDGLRLDAGLDLAVQDLLDELANLLGIDLLALVVGELRALGGVLNGEGRELLGVEVQVVGVSAESLSIDGSNVDSAAVLLSNGLEVLSELLALLGSLSEDVGQRNARLVTTIVSQYETCILDRNVLYIPTCNPRRCPGRPHPQEGCWQS